LKDLNLLRSVTVLSAVMKIKNGFYVFLVESKFFLMMTQPIVQNVDNGFDENVQNEFQDFNKTTCKVSNLDFVLPSTVGLRNNLSKNYNGRCGDNDDKILREEFI
jgi:hypothetical protein